MNARTTRAWRGAGVAATATIIAAAAHTLGGGGAPPPLLVLTAIILATPVGVALVGRRLSAWRVTAAVGASQLVLHLAFGIAGGVDADAAAPGHTHVAAVPPAVLASVPAAATDLGPLAHVAPFASPSPDLQMVLMHTAAALVTAAMLVRGERMLRALGRGIRSLFALPSLARPAEGLLPHVVSVTPIADVTTIFAFDASRRGPPRG